MKKILLIAFTAFFAVSIIQAQETTEKKETKNSSEKIIVKVKDEANPDIYVDGKKFDFPMELLDQNQIALVSVLKGEKAIQEYNAPNGVVLITTKKNVDSNNTKIRIRGAGSTNGSEAPIIIIDGEKVAGKKVLEKISPDEIVSIEVLKDAVAIEKYNAPDGVIIVTTKKGKKSK